MLLKAKTNLKLKCKNKTEKNLKDSAKRVFPTGSKVEPVDNF